MMSNSHCNHKQHCSFGFDLRCTLFRIEIVLIGLCGKIKQKNCIKNSCRSHFENLRFYFVLWCLCLTDLKKKKIIHINNTKCCGTLLFWAWEIFVSLFIRYFSFLLCCLALLSRSVLRSRLLCLLVLTRLIFVFSNSLRLRICFGSWFQLMPKFYLSLPQWMLIKI